MDILYIFCIATLCFLLFRKNRNKQDDEALRESKDENNFLKLKINDQHFDFQAREKTLNETIRNLQKVLTQNNSLTEASNSDFKKKEIELTERVRQLEKDLQAETENRKKIVSQKKSSEVRLGHIAETLAPFLDQFDFDPETCSFLGKPIDYISFGDDEITFIEVKSGNAQLNQRQRHIRDLVNQKLISWKEVRIK